MFPLGTVLLPGMAMPLRVFEPRYVALLDACRATGSFGVVLIARGSEVGGGDQRVGVGTLAAIMDVAEHDGRFELLVTGTSRIRVTGWLPDDPYPRARVALWNDEAVDDEDRLAEQYERVEFRLRRVLSLAVELGRLSVPITFTVPDDPRLGSWLLAAHSPLGPFDRQRLLEAPDPLARITLLGELLDDIQELLDHDLSGN